MSLQYEPARLQLSERSVLVYILEHEKARKITALLSDKGQAYLNEIQEVVGGSKTSTIQIIKALEKYGIIKSAWEIREFESRATPSSRAVKVFKLRSEKEGLLKYYEPLIKSSS